MMIESEEAKKANKNRRHYDRQVFDFFRETLEELTRSRGLKEGVVSAIAAFSLFDMVTHVHRWYNPRGSVGLEELTNQITRHFLHGFIGAFSISETGGRGAENETGAGTASV